MGVSKYYRFRRRYSWTISLYFRLRKMGLDAGNDRASWYLNGR
jgi:hypothetical protein